MAVVGFTTVVTFLQQLGTPSGVSWYLNQGHGATLLRLSELPALQSVSHTVVGLRTVGLLVVSRRSYMKLIMAQIVFSK